MMQATSVQLQKTVRIIPATIDTKAAITQNYRQLRVAAYCRVSTKQDEQLNSYEVQRTHYEERIRTEPKWSLVGIFADNGERNKYYIENNHPAIIDAGTFARVQEEIARRSGKPKVKQKGTKTELSRYSSKYALSELLICGECRTPYRRCTWTAKGKRKIVWRCINRLDYGKKYCHHSPSIEESLLQDAVMRATMQTAKQNIEVLKTLKIHIGMGLTDEVTEDKTLDIQIQIAEIDAEFQKMLKAVSADNADGIDEERITELMNEKQRLTVQLEQYATMRQKRESAKSRLDEIFTILDGLQNHPMEYDDKLVRQIIECVVVESKEKIKVVFIGGTEIEMVL